MRPELSNYRPEAGQPQLRVVSARIQRRCIGACDTWRQKRELARHWLVQARQINEPFSDRQPLENIGGNTCAAPARGLEVTPALVARLSRP